MRSAQQMMPYSNGGSRPSGDLGTAIVGVARAAQAAVHRRQHLDRVEAGPHVQLRREAHLQVTDALGLVVLGELRRDALERLGRLHHADRVAEALQVVAEAGVTLLIYSLAQASLGVARQLQPVLARELDQGRDAQRTVEVDVQVRLRQGRDEFARDRGIWHTRSITRRQRLPVSSRSVAILDTSTWTRVIRNATLATCAEGRPYGLIPKGAVALAGNRIAWVGSKRDVPATLPKNCVVTEVNYALVTPGTHRLPHAPGVGRQSLQGIRAATPGRELRGHRPGRRRHRQHRHRDPRRERGGPAHVRARARRQVRRRRRDHDWRSSPATVSTRTTSSRSCVSRARSASGSPSTCARRCSPRTPCRRSSRTGQTTTYNMCATRSCPRPSPKGSPTPWTPTATPSASRQRRSSACSSRRRNSASA